MLQTPLGKKSALALSGVALVARLTASSALARRLSVLLTFSKSHERIINEEAYLGRLLVKAELSNLSAFGGQPTASPIDFFSLIKGR